MAASSAWQWLKNDDYTTVVSDLAASKGKLVVLTSVAGDGAAYTATAGMGGIADDADHFVIFTPNVTNTVTTPTLSVDGGPAFGIGESGLDGLGVGRLIASYPVVLYRSAGVWRLLTDKYIKQLILSEVANRQEDVLVAEDSAEHQARWAAIQQAQYENPLSEGGRQDDAIFLLNGVDYAEMWIASNGDGKQIITVSNDQYVDVRHMKVGVATPVVVMTYPGSTATIITDAGNHLIGANALVQIFRDAIGAYHFNAISGAVTLNGGAASPACDYTIITGGQSLAARFTEGAGVYGFQRGWRDYNGDDTKKFWFVNGSTGGSGLVPASNATNYWWDPVADEPGPCALAWKAALDAIPAGQPAPALVLWIMDQTDAGTMGTDATLSMPAYKATYVKVFAWLQDQISTEVDTPIIVCPVGAWDQPWDDGVQAVRWTEMELIEEIASVHQGPAYFDLPRPWDDVHHHMSGQKLLGYRAAAYVDNLLNAAGHGTGPYVTGIAEEQSGKVYVLTIQQQSEGDFTRPLDVEGFGVYQAGANPLLNDWVNIVSTEWTEVGGGVWQLRLDLGIAFPGATVVFPHGACTWARRGRWPMNLRNDPLQKGYGNVWPLKPFKSGAF
ncbi:hypothetical protein [uncultured Cohaesibacter sp.]|uniref:hypothetical protein n=1 Tax=uncultured Cohaesibacter sp. TaxID=1002546 RepID=UPI0029C856E2|nr:hypothetical protein [uncultured Cohaesibacter sp.]